MVIFALVFALVSVAVDQLTKIFLYGKSFSVIGEFLWVESAFNDGAAFGFFSGGLWFFIILSIIVIAFVLYVLFSEKFGNSKFLGITLGLLLGGIIGNLIDRIVFGGVRDFIYFKSIGFAIFNFADAFICVSMVMLIIYVLFIYKPPEKVKVKEEEK